MTWSSELDFCHFDESIFMSCGRLLDDADVRKYRRRNRNVPLKNVLDVVYTYLSEDARRRNTDDKEDEEEEQKTTNYYKDFSANTSLHGVKYTAEDERSLTERIWWSVMVVCSFCICVYLVGQVWHKWVTSPVIVSFDENLTPIWKIPFPAITVCPISKTDMTKFNYTKICKAKKFESEEEKKMFDFLSMMCMVKCNIDETEKEKNVNETGTLQEFKNITLSMDKTMLACSPVEPFPLCSIVFTHVMTNEGMCFTYNMLHGDDIYSDQAVHDNYYLDSERNKDGWSLDNGYPKSASFHTYPRRAKPSPNPGMQILLKNHQEHKDYRCSGIHEGFMIAVHPPHVVPRKADFMQAPFSSQVKFNVKPSMMFTSKSLKNYAPDKRQCYFSFERKLKFYRNYTREYCESECIANYTMTVCGCVGLGMPRDKTMPICSSGSEECLNEAIAQISIMESNDDLPEGMLDSDDSDSDMDDVHRSALEAAFECHCLQSCTTLSYETTRHTHKMDMDKYMEMIVEDETDEQQHFVMKPGDTLTVAEIYLTDPHFIMSKRSELYGITDFLANCGGLIGVCLGFSILSLVEIIYFFVIRVFCDMKNKRNRSANRNHEAVALRTGA